MHTIGGFSLIHAQKNHAYVCISVIGVLFLASLGLVFLGGSLEGWGIGL